MKDNTILHASDKDVSLCFLDELTNCDLHDHEFYEFAVTVKNGFSHKINGIDVYPKTGDTILLRPGDRHLLAPKNGSAEHACLNIMIPASVFNECCAVLSPSLSKQLAAAEQPVIFSVNPHALASLTEKASEPLYMVSEIMLTDERLEFYKKIRMCLAFEMIGYMLNGGTFDKVTFSPCIRSILTVLEEDGMLLMSISELSEKIGYSASYLSRQFRKQFNMTLEQYMISLRLAKVKNLLKTTDEPLDRISAELGWKKTGSMIDAFKKMYGISPGKFRAEAKRKNM